MLRPTACPGLTAAVPPRDRRAARAAAPAPPQLARRGRGKPPGLLASAAAYTGAGQHTSLSPTDKEYSPLSAARCLLSAVCCLLPAARCLFCCLPCLAPASVRVSSWAASATRAALYRGRCSRAAARTRELSAAQSGGSDRRSCIQYTPPNTAQAAASTADTLFCTIVCHSPCLIAFYLLNIHFLRLRSTKRNVLISKTFQWSVGCAHCALSPAPPGCAGREETELTRFKCQLPLCRPALVLHPSSGARGGGRWRTRPRYQLSIVTTGCNQTAPPGQHGARSTIKNKITIKDFQ